MKIKLTDDDKKIAAQMGISEGDFLKAKAEAIAGGTYAGTKQLGGPSRRTDDEDEEQAEDGEGEEELDLDDHDAVRQKIAELESENEELKKQLEELDQGAEDEEAAAEGEEEETDEEDEPGAPKKKPIAGKRPKAAARTPSAEVAALRAELKKRDVIAVVDAACRAGKVTPAQRAEVIRQGMKIGAKGIQAVVGLLPSKVRTSSTGATRPASQEQLVASIKLTDADHQVIRQLGISEEQYRANLAAERSQGRASL